MDRNLGKRSCATGLALLLSTSVALGWMVGCRDAADPAPPGNLFLITADTWRGDHFLERRAGEPLTPKLEAFAARSVTFTDASSVGNETSPGVAGILTGLYPHRSGVVYNMHILPKTVPTLASILRENGFATAAWVANPVVRADFGFGRGFEDFEFLRRRPPQHKARAEELTKRAWAWLQERPRGQRVFAWLHYMDPHGPYDPPAEQRALFAPEGFDGPESIDLLPEGDDSGRGGIPYYQWHPTPDGSRDGRDYMARYAAEVRYLDEQVGALLSLLEEGGWLENSVVIVSSDHGEALVGDNGFYFSHANDLTQDQVHVPLLLFCSACEAGSSVNRPVSTADILPTALRLLGVPLPAELDGEHLLSDTERAVMSETLHEISVRKGAWKLRWNKKWGATSLVDLASDPSEAGNHLQDAPQAAAEIEEILQKLQALEMQGASISRTDLSDEERRELQALGYVSE